jgi:hypothetical protein
VIAMSASWSTVRMCHDAAMTGLSLSTPLSTVHLPKLQKIQEIES